MAVMEALEARTNAELNAIILRVTSSPGPASDRISHLSVLNLLSSSNGTPVDIFIDDQGTDAHLHKENPTPADLTLNPDYEQWSGYRNASAGINESSSCRWGALPEDYIRISRDSESFIGADYCNSNNASLNCPAAFHSQLFEGQIDWVTWKPVADYSDVDDPPR